MQEAAKEKTSLFFFILIDKLRLSISFQSNLRPNKNTLFLKKTVTII